MDCIFCKIIRGDLPSEAVYSDELVYAFKDIQAEAPVHILIVPKTHIPSLNAVSLDNVQIFGHIQNVAAKIAKEMGVEQAGYRLVTNVGVAGGQSVEHLHYHLLGGRQMKWPPG